MAARTTAVAARAPNQLLTANVPTITRNSPTNPFNPGSPAEANTVNRNAPISHGITEASPPMLPRSRVCVRSYTIPTSRNRAPVASPWFTIWSTPPVTPCCVNANTPSTTKPRCETDEYATSRLMSVWISAFTAP